MVKGVLIGCGVVALIGAIVLGVLGYQGYKFTKRVSGQIQVTHQHISDLNTKYAFTPEDKLKAEQIDRWLAVRQQMTSGTQALSKHLEALKSGEMGALERMKQSVGMVGAMREQIEEQIQLLDQARMSLREYTWISRQLASTLRSQAARADAALTSACTTLDGALAEIGSGAASVREAGQQAAEQTQAAASEAKSRAEQTAEKMRSVFEAHLSPEQIANNLELVRQRRDALLQSLKPMVQDFTLMLFGQQVEQGQSMAPAEATEPPQPEPEPESGRPESMLHPATRLAIAA